MKPGSIIWRRTFPDSAPGTDGVAIFEGRVIGRVREERRGEPRDRDGPKPWLWSVTDVGDAVAAASDEPLDRALARAARRHQARWRAIASLWRAAARPMILT